MESPDANPYAPPSAAVVPATSGYDLGEYHPAGNGRRFLNYIIDYAIVMVLSVLFGIVCVVLQEAGWLESLAWLENMNKLEEMAFGAVLSVAYYFPMESMFGFTLGKLVTGTRVVSEHGQKASPLAVLGRTFARLIPFEPFSFFGSRPGGWHDHLSGTIVIDIRNRQPKLSAGLRKIYDR